MKKAVLLIVPAVLLLCLPACKNADLWDKIPADISVFIDRYYPNSELASYTPLKDSYIVRLDNGPGFTFDSSYSWTELDGYGMPLKQIMIYDQAPETLYDYLETIEAVDGVFVLSRNSVEYRAQLLDQTVVYTISSDKVTTE